MTDDGLWMGLATIVAVFLVPVFAVLAARHMDDRRADKARKLDIFRTLMWTRGIRLDREHVGALNLVEVEFIDCPDVMNAWKAYLANLGEEIPSIEQKNRHDAFIKERNSLLTKLIDEIAKVLKIKVTQLDILEGNYVRKIGLTRNGNSNLCGAVLLTCSMEEYLSRPTRTRRNKNKIPIHRRRPPSKRTAQLGARLSTGLPSTSVPFTFTARESCREHERLKMIQKRQK